MLRRYSDVLNLPVLCADNGRKAGVVKDIVFDTGTRRVRALLLESKGLSVRKRVVLLDRLLSLGNDAAVVGSKKDINALARSEYSDEFHDEGILLGLKVFSKEGEEVGSVKDVVFDSRSGKIECFEVSDGVLQDVLQGRKLLPLFGKIELGEEFAIVGREAMEEMAETGGGIRNRLLKK